MSDDGLYAYGELESSYGYLSDYKPMRGASFETMLADLERQAKVLDSFFGVSTKFDIDFARKIWGNLPSWVEKLFLSIDKNVLAPDYNQELQACLNALKQTRDSEFYNYRECELGPDQLRQSERSVLHEERLAAMQKPFKLIVEPGNFGVRWPIDGTNNHITASVRRALMKMAQNESGTGAKKVSTWLMTHPGRLRHFSDLWIDCGGDEFAPLADSDFSMSPYFGFCGPGVELDATDVDSPDGSFGLASVCLPQG